jgi:hypothetical protein
LLDLPIWFYSKTISLAANDLVCQLIWHLSKLAQRPILNFAPRGKLWP